MQAVQLDSIIQRNGVKCVGYGGSGVGKTRLVATAPRPLYISAERGGLSLRGAGIMALPEIKTLADLIAAHTWVMQSNEAKAFDTICLDSVSEIADIVLRGEKSNSKDGRKAHGQANDLVLNRIYRDFRDMPQKHVYFIAKETSFAVVPTGTILPENAVVPRVYSPVMPNQTQRVELPYFFDVVFRYLVVGQPGQEPWRGLQTYNDGSAIAKDRSGNLAPYEPPDLGAMFTKAMGVR